MERTFSRSSAPSLGLAPSLVFGERPDECFASGIFVTEGR